jgi:hypothetical protein
MSLTGPNYAFFQIKS